MTISNVDRGVPVPSASAQTRATAGDAIQGHVPRAALGGANGAGDPAIEFAVHEPGATTGLVSATVPQQGSWQRFLELARRLVGLHAVAAPPAPPSSAAQRSALLRRLSLDAPPAALAFDFSHADLEGAAPAVAGLSHLRFNGANLRRASLHELSLAWTDFTGADLEGASITVSAAMLARAARPSVLAMMLQSIATIDPSHAALRRDLAMQLLGALQQAGALARRDGATLPSAVRTLVAVHPLFAGLPGVDAVLAQCGRAGSLPDAAR